MTTCIFCDTDNKATSIEHIVSESFGNKKYVMEKGKVCDICNQKFSKFEGIALSNSIFAMERARFGIKTKKGRNVKGQIKDFKIEGDKGFKKQTITVNELTEENFTIIDSSTNIGYLYVDSFDKSEVATSKLLLKVALESIYTSKREIFKKYDFKELKDFLQNKNITDWPFVTTSYERDRFISVPSYYDKYLLKKNHCELKYLEISESILLFKFKFGAVSMVINLLNRNLDWTVNTVEQDENARIYPEHFRNKLTKPKKNI